MRNNVRFIETVFHRAITSTKLQYILAIFSAELLMMDFMALTLLSGLF